ncbi:MAG: WD40 repeat domain-containing protein, partial [Pirellulaceae bacterium]|nr:WD40 repeat domain-containing protein [Pirellulaceae bacterium]
VLHQWKHESPLIACRFDPAGKYVFTSAEDMSVQRWEYTTGKKVLLEGHDSWVRDIAFLNNGEVVVTVASDDQMKFWPASAEAPTATKSVKAHEGWVRVVAVSPDGKLIATGGTDNLVKLWDADGSLVRELKGHDSNVYSLLFHPNGKVLLSGDLSSNVKQWNIADGKEERTFDAKELHTYNGGQRVHYGGVRGITLSPDGKHLACAGLYKATNPLGAVNEPIVVLFEWETGKKIRSLITDGVRGIAWRSLYLSNNNLVAASGGSGGGFLLFWDTAKEKAFHKFKMPDTVRGLDLHPDGMHLATVHYDRNVRISRMAAKTDK